MVSAVGNWLEVLEPYFPKQEILNYCVSLYYNRSMVALASLIIENFKENAYCPGDEKETFSFPGDLGLTESDGNTERKLDDFKGDKVIAFVSEDCPLSMVEAVSKARQLGKQKSGVRLIVAPMEKLSSTHLAMNKMIRDSNLLFINDEDWRKDTLPKKVKLPLFISVQVN